MAKTVPALLKDIAAIKNSEELNEQQKAQVLHRLRLQLNEATGQQSFPLPPAEVQAYANTGGVPPAPQSTPNGSKAGKAS